MPTSRHERAARDAGYRAIAGVDEAGRGALFGPVFAAAVVLNPDRPIRGLDDSKVLDSERRQILAERIRERAVSWSVASADAFEIDRINILEASRLAMRRAVEGLRSPSDFLLVDAIRVHIDLPQKPLIHGDALSFSIAAASILAKVARDAALDRWHGVFPEYGLQSNKGYSTPDHLAGLEKWGPTSLHRFSFAPVRKAVRRSAQHLAWSGYPLPPAPFEQGELFAGA
jgi:ribonuclease HII